MHIRNTDTTNFSLTELEFSEGEEIWFAIAVIGDDFYQSAGYTSFHFRGEGTK